MKRRDHAHLLACACAALETPNDLDEQDVEYPIEDIALAEDQIERHVVPWSIYVHVAQIDHCHGINHYASLTREGLNAEIAAFCRVHWAQINDPRDPATLLDEDASRVYFERIPAKLSRPDVSSWPGRTTVERASRRSLAPSSWAPCTFRRQRPACSTNGRNCAQATGHWGRRIPPMVGFFWPIPTLQPASRPSLPNCSMR